MIKTDLLVVGAGPAGLSAAHAAGECGANVMVLERSHEPGGQLVKQTHMFFGSEKQYAAYRGFDIADILLMENKILPNVSVELNSTILGAYDDGIWTAEMNGKYKKIKPGAVVVAAGASEKSLAFPGNDLPGVYGAGAVQTLMNQFGIMPAKRVVMLGAGNIGLIVSYQLLQAGVEVAAVIEGSPKIGGYLVHASKLRRMGVPIFTSHSIKCGIKSNETGTLSAVTVWQLDSSWNGIHGTEFTLHADTLCIAVGLSPLSELLFQAGCQMHYVKAFGGYVPARDKNLKTSIPGVYVAGDVAGVEEASAAMVEGRLAGYSAAEYLGFTTIGIEEKIKECYSQLDSLRSGESGGHILEGIKQLEEAMKC